MLLVLAVKTLVLGFCMLPIAAAALGVGILFAGYNIAVSRNPEEAETLFNGTLMGFALVETFVFMSFFFGIVVYFL
jgi:F0F1-type ATP synthase membrane subunit c/vacuolar-type H+-ATPase subunit K